MAAHQGPKIRVHVTEGLKPALMRSVEFVSPDGVTFDLSHVTSVEQVVGVNDAVRVRIEMLAYVEIVQHPKVEFEAAAFEARLRAEET